MIEQMKKISLVMLDSTKKSALKTLRKLGVVHMETVTGNSVELSQLKEDFATLEKATIVLNDIKLDKKDTIAQVKLSAKESFEKSVEILSLVDKQKELLETKASALRELDRFIGWGDVNPADFAYLSEKGLHFSMYEIPASKYNSISEEINILKVNGNKNIIRFLVINEDGKKIDNMNPEAYAVSMPTTSTIELKNLITKVDNQLIQISNNMIQMTQFKDTLSKAMKIMSKEIEFENYYSGLGNDGDVNHSLCWLTGYVPTADLSKVVEVAKAENWAYVADDPDDPDAVPTKLKNNKFISLIYPVSDFLGTVPGYAEYDISSWFLLFFCIFFGMIFGDGGYGLILTIAGLGIVISSYVKTKKVESMQILLILLGLSTTAWGALTCNWFGIAPENLPESIKPFLLTIDWNWISNASTLDPKIVTENVQIFCFTLALIQLTVAHFKAIFRYIKSPKFLGDLGSVLMLLGIYYFVLNMVVSSTRFSFDLEIFGIQVSKLMFPLIGGGFALNFIFSSYEDSVGKSILESFKNIISMLLGVVNVFSDIVSYIRLWAVGLAGAAIANTINEMAGPMLGGFIIFLGIILLVFGHGLNMILNVLSVIVHGVRLNTLEFSGHLGMSWSGFSYQPFAEGEK